MRRGEVPWRASPFALFMSSINHIITNMTRCAFLSFLATLFALPLWGSLRSFNDFHSNLGEIVIIRTERMLDTLSSKSERDHPTSLNKGSSVLTDEEIDTLLFGDLFSEDSEDIEDLQAPMEATLPLDMEPKWFHSFSIETGAGYADNPLYGNHAPQGSGYGLLGVETFSLSQANPQHELLLYLYGEGKKFTDLGDEDVSGLILGQMDYSFSPSNSSIGYGLRLQHTYFDQGMDFSEIGLPYRMKVTSNRSAVHPRLKWQVFENLLGVLELGMEKESYLNIDDASEDLQATLKLSGEIGQRWGWATTLEGKKTNFQDRVPKETDGSPLTGKLDTMTLESTFSLDYAHKDESLDETGMKFAYKKNSDEKGGYYEYDRWRISATQGLSWNAWQLDLAGGYTGTSYPKRLLTSGELLDRNGWAFDAGITREIGENWKSFLRWNHERESSNDTSFAFESNFWTIGVNWDK